MLPEALKTAALAKARDIHVTDVRIGLENTAVLGPSTPLAPDIIRNYGVTHLSGVIVTDPAAILRMVSEGGATLFFKGATKKINLVLSD